MFKVGTKVIVYSCGEGEYADVKDVIDEINHDKISLFNGDKMFDKEGNWIGGGGFPSAFGHNFKIRPNYDPD